MMSASQAEKLPQKKSDKKKYFVFDKSNIEKSGTVKIIIALVTVALLVIFLPSYKNIDTDVEVGSIWSNEDLIASFTFPVYKDEIEYKREKEEVIKNVIPVFIEQDNRSFNSVDSLRKLLNSFKALIQPGNKNSKEKSEIDTIKYTEFIVLNNLQLNLQDLIVFSSRFTSNQNSDNLFREFSIFLLKAISDYSKKNILNIDKSNISSAQIAIKKNDDKLQTIESKDRAFSKHELLIDIKNKVRNRFGDSVLAAASEKLFSRYLLENLIYSPELTELEIRSRIEQIPKTIGIVRENERIIGKHDPINKMTKLKLDSYKKIRLERLGVQDLFGQIVGKGLLIIILLSVLVMFLYYIRPDIYRDNFKLGVIASLLLLIGFFSFMSMQLKVNAPVELLIFISVASILLTILFDSRLAFFIVVINCFIVASIRGGDFTIAFISFSGGSLAIFSVRDIKNRSQIFRSFFFIFAGYVVSIIAVGLDRSESTIKIVTNLSYVLINSVMSPVIAYGLLIFYEKAFRITTDLTLLELADFNQPLLRELSAKAPGTFHHSVIMGNLAEEAAASIGANRILARVGCYYHDIGKIAKPSFFVENQIERKNKHENLNPNLSAKIIIAHIKDGIELAKKYKLPKEVIDFIPMHHGTTLVSYFYNKAKHVVDDDKEDIHDYIYRYPGPKPQTKETAIAMLADTVEASTKAIEDPTMKKLEDKIDEIIKKRFIEGELDECNLTLKELTNIKKSFLKILVGIYHQRIKYPEDKTQDED